MTRLIALALAALLSLTSLAVAQQCEDAPPPPASKPST
jgi:hypothetical protein